MALRFIASSADVECSPNLRLLCNAEEVSTATDPINWLDEDDQITEEEMEALLERFAQEFHSHAPPEIEGNDWLNGDEEPAPQKQLADPLIQYWKHRTPSLEPTDEGDSPSATNQVSAVKKKKKKKNKDLPPLKNKTLKRSQSESVSLAQQALQKREAQRAAKADLLFWNNRLLALQREVERAQSNVDSLRKQTNKFQVSVIVNETISAQLREEMTRNEEERKEKAAAIRLQKQAQKATLKAAALQKLHDRIEMGRQTKHNSQVLVESLEDLKRQEYEKKRQNREVIQREKVLAVLKRLKETALKREENRINFVARIQQCEEEEQQTQAEVLNVIEANSKLVQRIRKLREIEKSALETTEALQSLQSGAR